MDKPETGAVLGRLVRFFEGKPAALLLPKREAQFFGFPALGVEGIEDAPADMAISLGGDGTFLGVCHRYGARPIPVCGINLGAMGFMADIELAELEERLGDILAGAYSLERRLLLAGSVRDQDGERPLGLAVNDVVVIKEVGVRMLRLGLSINGTHLLDYKADGIIVASPTGSTAYSLSAGGPIMSPTIRALLVTPICAHTVSMRPLVVDEADVVHIQIAAAGYPSGYRQDIVVTFDAQETFQLRLGDEVIVRQADQAVQIVRFRDKGYYQILKSKLWN